MWKTRTSTYKQGAAMLFLSSAVYITGFASPFWVYVKRSVHPLYVGLWMWCVEESEKTVCWETFHDPSWYGARAAWFKAAQAMQCVGLILAVIACAYVVVDNVHRAPLSHCRLLEFLTTASGMAGIIGCFMFVGDFVSRVNWMTESVSVESFLSWSFALSITSCILFFITAAVICVGSRADQTSPGAAVQPRAEAPVAEAPVAEAPVAVSALSFPSDRGQLAQPVYSYDQVGAAFPHGGSALAAGPPQAGYTAPDD